MLEQRLNHIENKLTWYSIAPLDGDSNDKNFKKKFIIGLCIAQVSCIPIGFTKILLGIVQTTAAVGLSILAIIPACLDKNFKTLLNRSLSHIPHGLGNIAAGFFEAIPLVGSISVDIRFRRTLTHNSNTILTMKDHIEFAAFKFYPYASIKYPTVEALHKKRYAEDFAFFKIIKT